MTLMSLPTLKSLTSQIALKRHLCFTHKWRFIFYHTPYILLFIKFVESLERGRNIDCRAILSVLSLSIFGLDSLDSTRSARRSFYLILLN